MQRSSAVSPILGTACMLLITFTLVALLLLLLHLPAVASEPPPPLFTITDIDEYDEITNSLTYDSRIELMNKGTDSFNNDDLSAVIYRNDHKLESRISTLNGYLFIKTIHIGVQTLSGSGTRGSTWEPGEKVVIDLSDNMIHPGDKVTVEVIQKSLKSVISQDSQIA